MRTQDADVRKFLAKVLPFDPAGQAYINIHWTKVVPGYSKPLWDGRAFTDLNGAANCIEWVRTLPDAHDIYVCMSSQLQAEDKVSQKGKPYKRAIRLAMNAVALKSLFLDIDFKDGDHGYADIGAAVSALDSFMHATCLPPVSALVHSGGGLHVYWTFTEALSVHEWQILAHALVEATRVHGLKCDTTVTIDAARVLRAPNTKNFKYDPPKPTKLLGVGQDYFVDRIRRALEPYVGVTPTPVAVASILPPRGSLLGVSDLSAGVAAYEPVPIADVLPECPFLMDTVTSGGKDNSQPLWNLTTLISTFTDGGRTDAHIMSMGHPGYSKTDTDAMFDRKEAEQQVKGLGWPSCQTIHNNGAKQCNSCPNLSKGKSPLHFRVAPKLTLAKLQKLAKPLPPVGAPAASLNDILPEGYTRNEQGFVFRSKVDENTGMPFTDPVCETVPFMNPFLQEDPARISFKTFTNKGYTNATIELSMIGSLDMRKRLQAQFLTPQKHELEKIASFLMAWVDALKKSSEAAVKFESFGWNVKSGKVIGFAYGGYLITPQGNREVPVVDAILNQNFKPTGRIAPWWNLSQIITEQERPELDAIVAASFGAPLFKFTGHPGMLMSAYSQESGIGKTTAMRLAMAVWAHSRRGMQPLDSTLNQTVKKMGQLRHLPILFDELKTSGNIKGFGKMVFQLSEGIEKGRLHRDTSHQEQGTWDTLMVSASNESIIDTIIRSTQQTPAGLYRVFEYIIPPSNGKKLYSSPDVQRLTASLEDNYGKPGQLYAQFLAHNAPAIDKEVGALSNALYKDMDALDEERYWIGLIVCVLLGAKYANHLRLTHINEAKLKRHMLTTLGNMRGERHGAIVDMKKPENIGSVLGSYMNARRRSTLITNRVHIGAGRVPTNAIDVKNTLDFVPAAIHVQAGEDDHILRIDKRDLQAWLDEQDYNSGMFFKSLKDQFGAIINVGRIGVGTRFTGIIQTHYIDIDTTSHPSLHI